MDTRNLYTNLPEQINRQIEQKTQVNDINTQSVATTMQDGIEPIYVSQLNNPFDTNIPPAMPQIQWIVRYEKGLPIVDMTIIFTGKDRLGHDVNGQVLADIYRDLDNDGTFEDDELIDSIDLQTTNKFIDRSVPKDEIVRYKILLKNMSNRQQTWSEPITVSTSDKIIPYTPPIGVDPETSLDEIVVLTDNVNSITNGDNCNAVVKIKEHADDDLRMFEIQMRVVGATNWEKQPDVLANSALVDGYYYIGLKNLVRGTCYEIQVRVQRNSGNVSSWSDIISFMAGDYIGPQKPEKAYAVNVSTEAALGMQVCWSSPLATGNNGISEYKLYRWTYLNAASTFVDGSKTLIGTFAVTDINKITWAYIDTTVETGKYYAYEIIAYDNNDVKNPSTSTFTFPDLVVAIVDSETITVSYDNNDLTFPITVEWTYAGGYHGTYIALRENDEQKRILFQKDLPNAIKEYTITLQDFKEVDAKDFLEIEPWQTTHNYTVEIGSVYNATSAGTRRQRVAYETLLINPKPSDVADFIATYDALRHQMDFKWTKNTDAFLTGYEIRRISLAQWETLEAITGETEEDIANRKAIWNLGTVVADAKILNKDITDWTWQMPIGVDPSPADAVAYYFLIRAVGDFFVDYKYRSADFSKIIYSKESSKYTASVLQQLPAPTVDTSTYTSAVLDGTVMRINWQISLTADQKRQFKEFWLYMSTTATDVDNFDSTYRVWRGADLTTVLEKDHLGATLNYATTYYFRVVAVDHYDYPGNLSERFTNYPAGVLSVLPKAKITGTDFVRTIPIELNSRSETPLSGDDTVSVYKSRSMQFEITSSFTKNRYVDRIKWYISTNNAPYVYITETFFDKEKVNAEVLIPAGFKQTYAFSTDQVLFQVKAVQYRPDGVEGNLASTPASNYAKIDTMVPNLDIQKVWYKSDNSIAINKNGYINKKILTNGIDIYYRAYEKDSNSGINRVEYNYSGSTWVAATGSPINITNAMLGADTVGGVYKEFEIKLRAFDNAENSVEQVVRFKKDTVGPATSDLPTSLTWAFGRNITLSWVNPAKEDRNLYDGLKLFVGGTLATAKEYSLDSNPFSWKPASSPVQLFLAATDIADNLTYLDINGAIQADQDSPMVITITNAKPAPPANLKLNALVGGCEAFWDTVTLDVDGNAEEVEKYWVQYAIAETEPAVGSGDWLFPTNYETFSPKINISLSAAQMDAFAANGSLKLWVRVDASDYWGLRSDPSTAAFVVPKNITAVDMGGNIFKMKLSSNMTLTGTQDYILDANYLDSEYISFTNTSTDDYIKLDLVKAEWISDIKLKFKHSTSVRFVIKLEEVSGATTTDIWLQSSSSSDHTFDGANDINVQTTTKPAADRYFQFNTTNASVADIALLHYENFTTGRAIFAKSVSIYFYNADSVARNIVEFQPVVMSIANIFYGGEINLDYLVSVRSKADPSNYCYLTKSGLQIYQSNINVFSATTSGVFIRNAVGNGRVEINSTAFNVYDGSNVKQVELGLLDNSTYGLWAKDNIYLGGSSCVSSNLVVSTAGLSIGYISSGIYNSSITSSNIGMGYVSGLSYNLLISSSSVKLGYATVSGYDTYYHTKIESGIVSLGHISGGTIYNTKIESGNVSLGYDSGLSKYHVSIGVDYIFIGLLPSSYYNLKIEASSGIIRLGHITTTAYNTYISGTYMGIGYTGGYYNTKIESSAIYLGHISSGTTYKLSITSTEINMLGYDNSTSFFKVGQYQISSVNTNCIWSKKLWLSTTSGDNPTLSVLDSNMKLIITSSDSLRAALIRNSYNSNTNQEAGLRAECAYGYGIIATSEYSGTANTTAAILADASSGSGSGIYGSGNSGYGGRFYSNSSYGIYATSTSSTAIYASVSNNTYAIQGYTSGSGCAIEGYASAGAYGVRGYSATSNGVVGQTGSGSAYGGYFYGPTYALRIDGATVMVNMAADGTGTVLVVDGSGVVKKQSSSIYKKELLSYIEDFSMLKYSQLVPYKFRFKESGDLDIGFIAEWIEPIFPDLVNYGNDGLPSSLKYDRFSVYNVLAIQEHQREIVSLKSNIDSLTQMINELKNKVDTLIKTE